MKKARTVLAVMMAGVLLYGCGSNINATSTFSPTQSGVFVARDGVISSALVETYEPDYYDQGELKASIESAVSEYNAENGENAVALDSCTLGNGKAIALFRYGSGSDLCKFTEATEDTANQAKTFEFSTVSDGLVAGGVIDGSWKKAKDGSAVSSDTVIKNGDLKLITVDGSITVQTEGKIQYYSGNVSLTDGFTAVIDGGRAYIAFK